MDRAQLIRRFRALADDKVEEFFWSDEDLGDWLNDAQNQACVRGRLIVEDSNPDVCRIPLVVGQQTYQLHKKAYELIHLRIKARSGRQTCLSVVTREWLDAEVSDWRDCEREALWCIQDDHTIRVIGRFDEGSILHIECYRLPLQSIEDDGDEPEIHEAHHEHLLQWMLHKAFSMPDTEVFDAARAALAERAFTAYFGPLPDADLRRATRHDIQHHVRGYLT